MENNTPPEDKPFLGSPVDPLRDDVLPNLPQRKRRQFERLGFHFGEPLEEDALFVRGTLPPWWRKESPAHPWLTFVRDQRDRLRAVIHYQTQFFGRSLDMQLVPRCRIRVDRGRAEHGALPRVVFNADTILYEGPELTPVVGEDLKGLVARATRAAANWLNEHLPLWRDPEAYWEVDDLRDFIK